MVERQEVLDGAFSALSDGTRRSIVGRLARGPASVTEISRPFAMSLQAVAKHLRVLEQGGLVASEKRGRVRRYRLEPRALDASIDWLERRKAVWERRMGALGRHLDEGRRT